MTMGLLVLALAGACPAQLTVEIVWPSGGVPVGEQHLYLADIRWNGTPVTTGAQCVWDFGDGSDPYGANPGVHTYTTEANYTVSAAVTYQGQQVTATREYAAGATYSLFTLALLPASEEVSDPWDWEVTCAGMGPCTTVFNWGIVEIWKKRDNGDWELAPNITETQAGSKTGNWLTYGAGDQNFPIDVKMKITYQYVGPYTTFPPPPVTTWTNTITATPRNTVVRPTGDEPILILHDPANPAHATHTLGWDVTHQAWCHGSWNDEHLHTTVKVRPVTASWDWTAEWPNLRQDDPGPGAMQWTGAYPPPRPPAPKGIYTWQVTASHMYRPSGACPANCAHFLECPTDTDKAGRIATLTHFYYYELDDANDKMRGVVTYSLTDNVGHAEVRIYGPNLDLLWSCLIPAEGLTTGTHQTEPYEIDAVIQNGQLQGTYWAVILTKQTAEDGLGNRDREPKWHLPHGSSTPEYPAPSLRSLEFTDDIQMHWPMSGPGGSEALGTAGSETEPEWTVYTVPQPHFTYAPYSNATYNNPQPKNEPTAYVRNNPVKVTAVLQGAPGSTIRVRATGMMRLASGGSVSFPLIAAPSYASVTFDSTGAGSLTVTSPNALPNKVDVGNVQWTWTYSTNGTTYQSLGTSAHKVYVALQAPSGLNDKAYEHLYRFSCAWAKGATTEATVLDKPDTLENGRGDQDIWGQLSTLNVVSDRQVTLTYYGSATTNVTDTRGLLVHQDGQCHSWLSLLRDLAAAHGIALDRVELSGGDPPAGSVRVPGTRRAFAVRNFTAAGVAGQGMPTPSCKHFSKHFVGWSAPSAVLYDPSYGVRIAPAQSLDAAVSVYEDDDPSDPSDGAIAKYSVRVGPGWPPLESLEWNWFDNTDGVAELEGAVW